MRRKILHAVFVTFLSAIAAVVGALTAMTATQPGRSLLARVAQQELAAILRGDLAIGSIDGSFLGGLELREVTIWDSTGFRFATVPAINMSYRLPQLIAGQIVLTRLQLEQPIVYLKKLPSGRLNIEEIFKLGEGSGEGGGSPLIRFNNVEIDRGWLRIDTPWTPDDSITTSAGVARALARERAKPGRVIQQTEEGYRKLVTIDHLTARLPEVTLASPDGEPITLDIDSLYADVSDPQVPLRHAIGRVRIPGDSVIFSLEHGALPGTVATGGGVILVQDGEELFDFTFISPSASLADFRWVVPDFPDLSGSAVFTARSEAPDRAAFVIQGLDVTAPGGEWIRGSLTVVADKSRGTAFRQTELTHMSFPLEWLRPFLPGIPFRGTVDGTTGLHGYFDSLAIAADWRFVDHAAPGRPLNLLVGDGVVSADDAGLVFDSVNVRSSDISLATVNEITPSIAPEGRLEATGFLRGPLRNATFIGDLVHRDGDLPVSRAFGLTRLDTRGDTLAVSVDVELEPLAFQGLGRGYPWMTSRGEVRGRLMIDGPVTGARVEADVTGELGSVTASGIASLVPERLGGDSLAVSFSSLDLASLLGRGPDTDLDGTLLIDGVADTTVGPTGRWDLAVTRGRIGRALLDSARILARSADSIITLDTVWLAWPRGTAAGGGTVGWRFPKAGTLQFQVRSDSLEALDSLVIRTLGLDPDTTGEGFVAVAGAGQARVDLNGSLDAFSLRASGTGRNVTLVGVTTRRTRGTLVMTSGGLKSFTAQLSADSVTWGDREYPAAQLALSGRTDSLAWVGTVQYGDSVGVTVGGERLVRPAGASWVLDSLYARLPTAAWRLNERSEISVRDSGSSFSGLDLTATDGSGMIKVTPNRSGDSFVLEALGVGVKDMYTLLHRDTAGIDGSVAANLLLGGTRDSPVITGTIQLADMVFPDVRAPLGRGVVNYRNRRLDANLLLWRTGEPVMRVEARLPVDLALKPMEDRRVDEPLRVRAVADSLNIGVADAFFSSVDRLRGLMTADIQVEGTWERPTLTGEVTVRDASAFVPGLNVSFHDIQAKAHLVGDSIVVDDFRLAGRTGRMEATGWLRLPNLTTPVLDLSFDADNLALIDSRDFLRLSASGQVRLSGPFWQPVLTGSAVANSGVLYFADLVNKQVIDLEDPDNADLIDERIIRERRLGAALQNRFLDSLRINDLDLNIQDNFSLRSTEANIDLEGDLRVNKLRREYRLAGTLSARRGTYNLNIGNLVNRTFNVTRGNVRYFGTPDLDAQLDIEAEHVVRPVDRGEEIPIVATITGTLRAPQLTLTNRRGPPISQSDLVSYLMFGKPAFDLSGGANQTSEAGALQWGLTALSTALSSEVERTLVSDIGLPIDYLQIRPGATPVQGSSVTATRIAAGWRLTHSVFVTLSAGFCPNDRLLNSAALGASLEWRFGPRWRSSVSVEPVEACELTTQADVLEGRRYQIGVDLLWEKEY